MNTDKVQEILKNYRSYRYAASNGIAGWNPYDSTGMPMGGSFGSRVPTLSTGLTVYSEMDLVRYGRMITLIDGAVNDVLDDDEAMVIKRKYMDRNKKTLDEIAYAMNRTRQTISNRHKSALNKLNEALKFFIMDAPEIINLDTVVKQRTP